jgi:hypothetical protein
VKLGGMLRQTVVTSTALAASFFIVAAAAGNLSLGLGVGIGLVIGSFNGLLVAGTLRTGAPFVPASLVRMMAVSAVGILAALFLGIAVWTVLIGVGAAQLVLVTAGVRQGLRA